MEHQHRHAIESDARAGRPSRPPGIVHALIERIGAHRERRRVLACLECGLERMAGPDAGECPACGYLGWRDASDRDAGTRTVPLLVRDPR